MNWFVMRIKKITHLCLLILIIPSLLTACASSELARGTAQSVDQAYIDVTDGGQLDVSNTYQNTNQTTKGVLIGGVTGGILGSMTAGVGVAGGAISGAILLGALGAYIDAHATLVDRLINRGVKVFILGDQVMLVVHSSRVFIDHTPVIRNSFFPTLDLISQLIGKFTNISVKVSAYSNATGASQIDCSLTQLQAESVEKALWKRGVNTRFIYAAGFGGTHLVTKNAPGDYSNDNYRIEITFEKLPI